MNSDDDDMPPTWIWRLALGLFVFFVGLSIAFASVSWEPERPAVAAHVSDKPALLVFESASCGWCRHFRANVAPGYERSHLETLAPLKYVDIAAARPGASPYRLNGRVVATPTFVLVDRTGREVERLRGLPGGGDLFMQKVEHMLGRLPETAAN